MPCPSPTRGTARSGTWPLNSCASATARTCAPFRTVADRLRDLPRHAFTPHTALDDKELRARIRAARNQGWCLVNQELEEGLISIEAPLKNRAGQTIAALNINGQANRTNAKVMQAQLLPALLQASQSISLMLASRRG